jgi:hypothetical protein
MSLSSCGRNDSETIPVHGAADGLDEVEAYRLSENGRSIRAMGASTKGRETAHPSHSTVCNRGVILKILLPLITLPSSTPRDRLVINNPQGL